MTTRRVAIIALILVGAATFGAGGAFAQLSETTSFLAYVSNEYRVVPNVTYHVASGQENAVDLYLPRNATGPTPVVMYIHGGGWRGGSKEGNVLATPAVSREGVGRRQCSVSSDEDRAGSGRRCRLSVRPALGDPER